MGAGRKSAGIGNGASRRCWVATGLVVVVVVIVVFAVAQGGGSGGGPLNAIAKAAVVTRREPGGHAAIQAVVTSSTMPEGLTENGSMVFDDSGRVRGTITVRAHGAGREERASMIGDGTTVYMSSDLFDQLPEGKKWMELDFSSATKGTGSSVPANVGPEEGLKVLERVQGAKEIGTEEISGVPTKHYRGTLPTPGEVFGAKVDFSALQVDVWIDSKDRVRRLQMVVSGELNKDEGSSTTEMTIDYVDFGQVPKIELPPADEVFNATSEVESKVQAAAEGGA